MKQSVAVIDLFSGPGGLGEGFAALSNHEIQRQFQILLSIENDSVANATLRLRAFLRKFRHDFPNEYYEHLNNSMLQEPDWARLYPQEWEEACIETPCVKLGTKKATDLMKQRIKAIRNQYNDRTVLLGGPPCQAYSVAGRARNAGNPNYNIHEDPRLLLYKEYVKVLNWLQPPIAVMENVKGLLSARHNNGSVFENVMDSLQNAGGKGRYRLFSLSPSTGVHSWGDGLDPTDFLVRSEEHGIPQRRHRVFVVCIRYDIASMLPENAFPKLMLQKGQVTVNDIIGDMPVLRSRLSRGDDAKSWQIAIKEACSLVEEHLHEMPSDYEKNFRCELNQVLKCAKKISLSSQNRSSTHKWCLPDSCPQNLRDWLSDNNLSRLPNNETRGHIREDIMRYLYAASFAKTFKRSPRASDFPDELAPKHANWTSGKFADRFRVQLADHPATTITSHISKDGHYFIHPDPRQCRSLTVREAARLQTFPDNYFFHGTRTQQYVQVGNAVPPYLASQIAEQVWKVLEVLKYCNHIPLRSNRQCRLTQRIPK